MLLLQFSVVGKQLKMEMPEPLFLEAYVSTTLKLTLPLRLLVGTPSLILEAMPLLPFLVGVTDLADLVLVTLTAM